jgi:hypothetical protein
MNDGGSHNTFLASWGLLLQNGWGYNPLNQDQPLFYANDYCASKFRWIGQLEQKLLHINHCVNRHNIICAVVLIKISLNKMLAAICKLNYNTYLHP